MTNYKEHLASRRVLQLIVGVAQAVRRRLGRCSLALRLERCLIIKGGPFAALQQSPYSYIS